LINRGSVGVEDHSGGDNGEGPLLFSAVHGIADQAEKRLIGETLQNRNALFFQDTGQDYREEADKLFCKVTPGSGSP